jgi:hypothetical protein
MSEAELTTLSIQCADAVLQVVAIYFSIVSAYIAALYYFLKQSPFLLKGIAFAFLSGALAFLGITIIAIERTTAGVIAALHALPARIAAPPPTNLYFGLDVLAEGRVDIGVMAGWAMAFAIYLSLFYLTFLHRWRRPT